MKTLYYNAVFHTMDPAHPHAEAVLCEDGIITEVGSRGDMIYDEETDLSGAHVLPGFIDVYTAPAIEAFCRKAPGELSQDEVENWCRQAADYLLDKGVAVLPLRPGCELYRRNVAGANASLICDADFRTDLDEVLEEESDASGSGMEDLLAAAYGFGSAGSGDYYAAILDPPESSNLVFMPLFDQAESVADAIRRLTCEAAELIGKDDLGTLAKGKRANFTIFDEDPLAGNLKNFSRMHADKVIAEGNLLYDVEDSRMAELYDMMLGQMF